MISCQKLMTPVTRFFSETDFIALLETCDHSA